MAVEKADTKGLLPALSLPLPLSIDFSFEANHLDDLEDVELHSSRTPTDDDEARDSSSSPPFNASDFLEFPTIEFDDMTQTSSDIMRSDFETSLTSALQHFTHSSMPSKPLDWIWICHICHNRYPLGATRRCLVDGHYYCSGQATNQRNVKRKKRGISCSSEFDYAGWKQWGTWRRGILSSRQQHLQASRNKTSSSGVMSGTSTHGLQDCENCEYPSACRYEKMNLSTEESHVVLSEATSPTSPPDDSKNQLLDIDVKMTGTDNSSTPINLASETIEDLTPTKAQTTVLQPIPTASLITLTKVLEVAVDMSMKTETGLKIQSKNELDKNCSKQTARCSTDSRQNPVDGDLIVEAGFLAPDRNSDQLSQDSNAGTPTGRSGSKSNLTERYYSKFQEAVDDSCPDGDQDEIAFQKKGKNTRTDSKSEIHMSGPRSALLQYMASIENGQSSYDGVFQDSKGREHRQKAREDGRDEFSKRTRDKSQILINELFGKGNRVAG